MLKVLPTSLLGLYLSIFIYHRLYRNYLKVYSVHIVYLSKQLVRIHLVNWDSCCYNTLAFRVSYRKKAPMSGLVRFPYCVGSVNVQTGFC